MDWDKMNTKEKIYNYNYNRNSVQNDFYWDIISYDEYMQIIKKLDEMYLSKSIRPFLGHSRNGMKKKNKK